ncbi:MAG: acyl-CoA/acyl-ACP dehydrogenase [SAR324 cluster bacterium]|nr:acyl-CoA/acyl-ACP dehydrogenase [SAR324 cluster bacterium]MCZ6558105.1 acyl-CoA/acyl-ACP dehydrogenase [SAR324 cluster bacterium]MCZ6842150.1 acyl-CoA/acyl-ACP dehydrogenase [SAR324 cluster bacterium]
MNELLNQLTAALAGRAQHYDLSGEWPAGNLRAFGEAGGWRWSIPSKYGGEEMPAAERFRVYGALARGCMNTALYVTQHESALDLIVNSSNEALKTDLLPRYARGEGLTTIGYAQLTTSHQGGAPALRASFAGDEILLEGFMPWVTGAGKVESVASGAVMPNGEQVVVQLPFDTPGVEVRPPMKLLALDASHTSAVHCTGVRLPMGALVAGPLPFVLARRSPIRRLSVSATGLGLLAGIEDCMREMERPAGSTLPPYAEEMQRQREALTARLGVLAGEENAEKEDIDSLRADINALLVRISGVLMTIAKGTGYRIDRPAQRLVREALFFCVWSAQDPIRQGTIERLLGRNGHPEGE